MAVRWNPRYVAYASTHQSTPTEQLAADKAAWPGGCMVPFMGWVQAAWSQWRRLRSVASDSYERPEDFDHWLQQPKQPAAPPSEDPS